MIVAQPDQEGMAGVLLNLRDQSKEELDMLGLTPERYLNGILSRNSCRWLILHNGAPAALIGAYPTHGGVWSLFGFGTDLWRSEWRLVTGAARGPMMRHVRDAGAHRAHCLSPASHVQTHLWLRALGARHEAQMPRYGVNGEDFIMFAWLRD